MGFVKTISDVFKQNISTWDYLLDAYKGGKTVTENYLYPWLNEVGTEVGKKIFERRKKITPYYNFSRKIVKAYNNYIYKTEPTREQFPEMLVHEDSKKSWVKQIKACSIYSTVCGKCFLFVDKPQALEGQIINRLQQKAYDFYPYIIAVPPNQVYNWSRDENDNITQIVWYKIVEKRIRAYYWDTVSWAIFDGSYDVLVNPNIETAIGELSLVSSGEHGLGVVPVVEVNQEDSDLIEGSTTWFYQIVQMDITYYNKLSVKNLNIDQQALGILVLPDSYQADKNAAKKVGVSFGYYESENESGITRYVSPDSKITIAEIREDLETDKNMIYFIAGLTTAKQLNMAQTVESKEFDFIETEKFLSSWAGTLEKAEKRALVIAGIYENLDFSKLEIKYNREFKQDELSEIIINSLDVKTLDIPSETFRKFVSKKVIQSYTNGQISKEDLDKMLKEVDTAKTEGEITTALERITV